VALFDPLLEKSGSSLLSLPGSQSTLQKACEALADCDHETLVHFVMVESGRANRPISGPRAVVGICQDARKHWEKNGRKPVKRVSQADIDKLIEAERAERAARKRGA